MDFGDLAGDAEGGEFAFEGGGLGVERFAVVVGVAAGGFGQQVEGRRFVVAGQLGKRELVSGDGFGLFVNGDLFGRGGLGRLGLLIQPGRAHGLVGLSGEGLLGFAGGRSDGIGQAFADNRGLFPGGRGLLFAEVFAALAGFLVERPAFAQPFDGAAAEIADPAEGAGGREIDGEDQGDDQQGQGDEEDTAQRTEAGAQQIGEHQADDAAAPRVPKPGRAAWRWR